MHFCTIPPLGLSRISSWLVIKNKKGGGGGVRNCNSAEKSHSRYLPNKVAKNKNCQAHVQKIPFSANVKVSAL